MAIICMNLSRQRSRQRSKRRGQRDGQRRAVSTGGGGAQDKGPLSHGLCPCWGDFWWFTKEVWWYKGGGAMLPAVDWPAGRPLAVWLGPCRGGGSYGQVAARLKDFWCHHRNPPCPFHLEVPPWPATSSSKRTLFPTWLAAPSLRSPPSPPSCLWVCLFPFPICTMFPVG